MSSSDGMTTEALESSRASVRGFANTPRGSGPGLIRWDVRRALA